MHEEALLRDLVRKLGEVARASNARRVSRVRIWVGALAHLSEAGLRDRWPSATRGTSAEGSELELTVSSDPHHPRAQEIVLESVSVVGPGEPPRPRPGLPVSPEPTRALKKGQGVRAPVESGPSTEGT